MSTEQGQMLTRIACAHRRAVDAEAAYQDAKKALTQTGEFMDLENARVERNQAGKALSYELQETEQLPLPEMGQGEQVSGPWPSAARVVTA